MECLEVLKKVLTTLLSQILLYTLIGVWNFTTKSLSTRLKNTSWEGQYVKPLLVIYTLEFKKDLRADLDGSGEER